MKILLALPRPLFPPDTGGKIRSLQMFSRLGQRHEIHAISFAQRGSDETAIREMMPLFKTYTPIEWRESQPHSWRFYTELLTNQFGPLPYFLDKCDVRAFRCAVDRLIARELFDVVFCDFLHTAVPLRAINFHPKVVFEHNVEFMLRKRKWKMERRRLHRVILANEWQRTQKIEAEVCQNADHVIAVSDDDRDTLRQEFGIDHVSVLPIGVDCGFFRPTDESSRSGQLVFVGSMDWGPNEDGVLWFARHVYPLVRRSMPHARFSIVGRNPSPAVRALASNDSSIDVTGRVPDVRPYLAQAEVVLVPLRIGGGTRIKIPEAMAMRKAVVSTPVGAEGLPFLNRLEIRLAQEPDEFASAVTELLKTKSIRESIGTAARLRVEKEHSWESVVDQLDLILQQVKFCHTHGAAA